MEENVTFFTNTKTVNTKSCVMLFNDLLCTAQITHPVWVMKTRQLMPNKERMPVCSEVYTKLCGQKVVSVNVQHGDAQSNRRALKGEDSIYTKVFHSATRAVTLVTAGAA
jgi:hypothetical protein